jgi:hypothetical protein
VRTTSAIAIGGFGNSSGISVIGAPAALPAPSARCPAERPIITTKNQRLVVSCRAGAARSRGAVLARGLESERGTPSGSGRSLSIVFGTCATRIRPPACSATRLDDDAVSSPPIVIR